MPARNSATTGSSIGFRIHCLLSAPASAATLKIEELPGEWTQTLTGAVKLMQLWNQLLT
jgi:hypothetical protein